MRMVMKLKKRLALWLLRLVCENEQGGLSLGGPGSNTLRDIYNTINSGGGVPAEPLHSVQVHYPQGDFGGYANFRYTEGTGVRIGQDVKVILDSNAGSEQNYVKYNSSNDYTEIYTDGAIRAQF